MIPINRTTPFRPFRGIETKPVGPAKSVEDLPVEETAKASVIERRKNPDRRRQQRGNRFLETRSGRDRRKNSNLRRPRIDIEA